jgi:hypothetical protein
LHHAGAPPFRRPAQNVVMTPAWRLTGAGSTVTGAFSFSTVWAAKGATRHGMRQRGANREKSSFIAIVL